MSMNLLESTKAWIQTLTLDLNYNIKLMRYGKKDLDEPVLLIRKSGTTQSDSNIKKRVIDVSVIGDVTQTVELVNDIDAIEQLAQAKNSKPAVAIKAYVLQGATNPIPMENDKFYCMVRIEITTEPNV